MSKTKDKRKRNPAPAKVKAQRLSIKERKFIKEYVKSGNGTRAVQLAGYNYKNDTGAGVEASRLLKKAKVKKGIQYELNKVGATKDYIASKALLASEAINDTTVQSASLSEGLKALEFIAKLHGLMDKNKTITKKSLNVSIKANSREDLHKMVAKYEDQMQKYKSVALDV